MCFLEFLASGSHYSSDFVSIEGSEGSVSKAAVSESCSAGCLWKVLDVAVD